MLIIDPVNAKSSHSSFNATLIKAISGCNDIDFINIYVEREQSKNKDLKHIVENTKKIKNIHTLDISNSTSKMINLLSLFKMYFNIYETIQNILPSKIVFLAADNLFSPIFILILKFITNNQIDAFVILHNNIENIQGSWLKKKLWTLNFKKNVIGIVLAEFVKVKAQELFPTIVFQVLPHPTYKHLKIVSSLETSKMYNTDLLVLGRHSNAFKDKVLADKLFSSCLSVSHLNSINITLKSGVITKLSDSNIHINEYTFPMSDKEYWQMLHTSKFLIIPPSSSDRLTASGVLADALTAGLLIIAPRVGAFIEFIPKQCHILLYENYNIESAISIALSLSMEKYVMLKTSIVQKSEELSLLNTTKKLNQIFETIK